MLLLPSIYFRGRQNALFAISWRQRLKPSWMVAITNEGPIIMMAVPCRVARFRRAVLWLSLNNWKRQHLCFDEYRLPHLGIFHGRLTAYLAEALTVSSVAGGSTQRRSAVTPRRVLRSRQEILAHRHFYLWPPSNSQSSAAKCRLVSVYKYFARHFDTIADADEHSDGRTRK